MAATAEAAAAMMVDGEVTTEAVTSARHGRRGGGAGVLRSEQGAHEADPASEQRPLSDRQGRSSSSDDDDDDRARGCSEGQKLAFQIKNSTESVNRTRLDVLL